MSEFYLNTLVAFAAGLSFSVVLLEAATMFAYADIDFDLYFSAESESWRALPLLFLCAPAILLRHVLSSWTSISYAATVLALALAWAVASGHALLSVIALVQRSGIFLN